MLVSLVRYPLVPHIVVGLFVALLVLLVLAYYLFGRRHIVKGLLLYLFFSFDGRAFRAGGSIANIRQLLLQPFIF